jgi:hypothetical protein
MIIVIVLFTVLFALGSISELLITEDIQDIVVVGE